MAAFVLSPRPSPSQNPAPQATMFFNAPQSSTVFGSSLIDTLKYKKSDLLSHVEIFYLKVGRWKSSLKTFAFSPKPPTVDSQN